MGWYRYEYYTPRKKLDPGAQLAKLRKKDPGVSPVVVTGRKIATTWWGEAWNHNLERYSDYVNRLPRGRSYVRGGNVLDLRISAGHVTAVVAGSSLYNVEINIKPLSGDKWKSIVKSCGNKIADMEALVEGKFPKELGELFTAKGSGLFPTPKELEFSCDCPDWATMCKHVAAALYGVGSRLDEDPSLYFTLRDIQFQELLKKTVESKMRDMLKNAGKKTGRTLSSKEAEKLFQLS